MDDETKTTDNVEETTEEKYDWRDEPGAKAMGKKIADLEKKLAQAAQASQEAAEKRERKKLEDREQYDAIVKDLENKMASLQSDYESKMVAKDLDIALTRAGFTNPLLLQGAKAGYDGTSSIDDYVEGLLADEATQALLTPTKEGAPAAKFTKPSSQSSTKSLDERLKDGDVEAQKQKLTELTGINFK